jgi:hypothetical protein
LSPPPTSHARIQALLICHYCQKGRSPYEILHLGTGGALMCWKCHEWHEKAIEAIGGGEMPSGCQACGRSYETLRAESPAGDCKLYLHPCDGIYQVRCRACRDAYLTKRVDLYGPTRFGFLKKLK